MSSTAPAPAKGKKAKKPFWQMELGKKKGADLTDEEVEHPPFVPTLPRVNLLPPAIRQSIAMRKLARNLIVVVLLVVVAFAGIWYLQGSRIADAEARLADAQVEGSKLQAQVEALAPITILADSLAAQKALVESTLASQPQASVVIQKLNEDGRQAAGGKGLDFSNISITYQGIPPAGGPFNPCPNPNPFGVEITMGCITFNATASDRQQVSRLLEVMDADPMFVGPYVTSTAVSLDEKGKSAVTFSGTAGVSLDALETALTQEQIDAILTPPQPAATPGAKP